MKSKLDFQNEQEYREYLRTLISAMCLQGILANHAIALPGINANNKTALAIVHADTLLSQLEKTKQHE